MLRNLFYFKTVLWLKVSRLYYFLKSYYNHYVKYAGKECKFTMVIIAYNQLDYIEKTINSVLSQKVNFKYKIIIADDGSTDGTSEIVKKYAKKYPEIITPLIREENLGCPDNLFYARHLINTEYWAILEGDDYLTDSNKLQMQFDIMNKNLNCVFCAHEVDFIKNGASVGIIGYNLKEGVIKPKQDFAIHPSSRFVRNIINLKSQKNKAFLRDTGFVMFSVFFGNMYFIKKPMSVYNYTGKGIWSSLENNVAKRIANVSGMLNIFSIRYGSKFVKRFLPHFSFLLGNHIALKLYLEGNTSHYIFLKHKLYKEYKKQAKQNIIKKPLYVASPITPNIISFFSNLYLLIKSKMLTNNGKYNRQLEKELKQYLKVPYVSTFNNGTNALISALSVLGLPKGSEVITTPFTFAATAHAISILGYKVVFADIDEATMTISPKSIKRLINPNTSAILGVHVYGYPCDVAEIDKIAKEHNLKVIYDGAHSFTTKTKSGESLALYGDITMHSFHATKLFNTIEGGCLVTKSKDLKTKIDLHRNFGIEDEDIINNVGINGKLNELQALVGLLNLKNVKKEQQLRAKVSKVYIKELSGLKGVTTPSIEKYATNSFQYFPVKLNQSVQTSCANLQKQLQQHNIHIRKYFFPICSDFECYKNEAKDGNLELANRLKYEVICLPFYSGLLKQKQHIKIAKTLKYYLQLKGFEL